MKIGLVGLAKNLSSRSIDTVWLVTISISTFLVTDWTEYFSYVIWNLNVGNVSTQDLNSVGNFSIH